MRYRNVTVRIDEKDYSVAIEDRRATGVTVYSRSNHFEPHEHLVWWIKRGKAPSTRTAAIIEAARAKVEAEALKQSRVPFIGLPLGDGSMI